MNKTLRNLALVALVAAPFSAFAEIAGTGTADDPYQVASDADLVEVRGLVKHDGSMNYIIQTKDFTMSDEVNAAWLPFCGGDGATYDLALTYDGQNHVIDGFKPGIDSSDSGKGHWYAQSLFGVLFGTVKNLGFTNIEINAPLNGRAGAIAGYLGTGNGTDAVKATSPVQTIENVYVTGKVVGGPENYTGGLFGTTGSDVVIKNCFVNVEMSSASGSKNGAFAGRLNNPTTITYCYVAGTVAGTSNLVTGQNTGKVTIDGGFVVFNTGSEVTGLTNDANEGEVTMANASAADKAEGIAEVKGWPAFSATETVGDYPALEYALSGEGSETSPYIIDSQKALCNAWKYVDGTKTGITYFVQTADIDMTGVTLYHPISGWNGSYKASLNYDGKNHVISNFAPTEPAALGGGGEDAIAAPYYSNSIFGVLSGTLKNLAVIDAECHQKLQGVGILGAYVGHSDAKATPKNTIENVFVSGVVNCEKIETYAGGMFGTTGTATIVKNSFANVDLVITEASTVGGGLIGRVNNGTDEVPSEFTNCYVAGTVDGAKALLVSNTTKTPNLVVDGVIAFNTGATEALAADIKAEGSVDVPETDDEVADAIAEVQGWEAFSATKLYEGYPILKAFEALGEESGIFEAAVEVEEANGPAVYYNLQGVQVANPDNGIYIVRRGNKVTKELIRK